jgi:gas vesicle protein
MPTAPEYSSRLPYSPTRTPSASSASAHSSAMHPSSMQSSTAFSSLGSPSGSSSMDSGWSSPDTSSDLWSSPDSSNTSWSSLAAGLCAGACVGAALALIFAPMRGTDMRNSVRNYASQGGERLSRLVESGRCLAEDAFNQAASVIEEGRRAFRPSADAASSSSSASSRTYSSPQPLTASVAEIAGLDRRFEEPLGG